MDLVTNFINEGQRGFYYSTARNQLFSGGFNNGKSYIGCTKIRDLALTYGNTHWAIARQTFTDLKKTTLQTFWKVCPKSLVKTFNAQDGVITLFNDSIIFLIHLDAADESTLRGFELNGYLIDQAEETEEKTFDVLDARIGRWDEGIINPKLLELYGDKWPKSKTGKFILPSYGMLLSNPEDEFHYLWRKFHPDSPIRIPGYEYFEGEWDKNLGSEESYSSALRHDEEWVDKYVRGKWGVSSSAIHKVPPSTRLEPTPELLERIKEKGNLFRSMDHGDSAPTCVLWVAAIDGVYIFYREYYSPGRTISYHRQAITDLSEGEKYAGNYADPQIFKKTAQKEGGFWSVSDEYITADLDAPPITWIAADNNEFATRNRINELLMPQPRFRHPVTKESPAPGIYFIKASADYPYGCNHSIQQLGMQKKVLIGTIDGKSIYSDDRDENVPDHAYDPIRYFVAMHGSMPSRSKKAPPRRSFAYYQIVSDMIANRAPIAGSIN